MSLSLLERARYLAMLQDRFDQAAHGNGRCVLLGGEAGVGKTTLLESFAARHPTATRFLWGRCEALYTPRPLGPLYDIATELGAPLNYAATEHPNRATIFAEFLSVVQAIGRPTVLIIEDIHWADEATLDFIKYLGRRLQKSAMLLIVTYRDDEVGSDHKLWFVFGDLPSKTTAHIHLPPLSEAAVIQLANEAHHPAANLFAITGGNPFFVSEVLGNDAANDVAEVPETVRAAVLARASRLSAPGRALLDLAAVIPVHVEYWLFDAVYGDFTSAVDECVRTGVLSLGEDSVAFRHELARQAIESTLPPYRAKALHAQVMRALIASDPKAYIARIVHHAIRANEGNLVLQYAPEAARQAATHGAHREAASLYAAALRNAVRCTPLQRAELLEGLAYECYLTNQLQEARQARTEVLEIARSLGDLERVGHTQRWLSRLNWYLGQNAAAESYGAAAVETLQELPPGRELAMAYSNRAQLCMLAGDLARTREWGGQAIDLAQRLHDGEILSHALNNVGAAEMNEGIAVGRAKLEESLRIAIAHDYEEHAARAYTNLASGGVMACEYPQTLEQLEEGIAYCTTHDLDSWRLYMSGWRARALLDLGDWTAATEEAEAVLAMRQAPPVTRISALVALASIRFRRGDSGSALLLDEALRLALDTGELQRIAPVVAARAERAWLAGDVEQSLAEARIGQEIAQAQSHAWDSGQVMFWLWQSGGITQPPAGIAAPYVAQMAGDWQKAADIWAEHRCSYRQALALSDGDPAAQRQALEIFHRLGAQAAVDRLIRRLEATGTAHIPRGPRSSTRSNPANLTARQLEVLLLMAEGLTNSEIAGRLSASPKTIEHHVSSILAKLSARTRAQAITEAHKLDIISTAREQPRLP